MTPEVKCPSHPVLEGIQGEWPAVLGYNKSVLKPEAECVVEICQDPFIAFAEYGKGKSGILSTDCAPHWAPPEFCNWDCYDVLFKNILDYLTK